MKFYNLIIKGERNNLILIVVLLIFLISLTPRLYYLERIEGVSGGDAYNNLLITKEISLLKNPFAFKRLPFYPFLLLPGHYLSRYYPNFDPIIWSRFVSALSGSITPCLVFMMAIALKLDIAVGIIASLLTSFSFNDLSVSVRPLSNSLFSMLAILSLLIFYLPKFKNQNIFLGILLCLLSSTRHEGFVISFILIFFSIAYFYSKRNYKKIFYLVLPIFLLICMILLSNILIHKSLFYFEYFDDPGLYQVRNIDSLFKNFQLLKDTFLRLWFSPSTPALPEILAVMSLIGAIILFKQLRLKTVPLILVLFSQIIISLWFQPNARFFQQTIPLLSLNIALAMYFLFWLVKKRWGLKGLLVPNLVSLSLLFGLMTHSHQMMINSIRTHNIENKDEYLLRKTIIYSKSLQGKIGLAADFPQAVYHIGEKAEYFTSRPPKIESKEIQLNWLRENKIEYFIWDSGHPYFNLFDEENASFNLIKGFSEGKVTVKIYKLNI